MLEMKRSISSITLILIVIQFTGCSITFSKAGSLIDRIDPEKIVLEKPLNLWKLEKYDRLTISLKNGEIIEGELEKVEWNEYLVIKPSREYKQRGSDLLRVCIEDIEAISYIRMSERGRKTGMYVGMFVDVVIILRYVLLAISSIGAGLTA